MILSEILNSKYEWEFSPAAHKGDVHVRFRAGDRDIQVDFEFEKFADGVWEVAFAERHPTKNTMKFDITSSGNEFRVFATVVDIIKAFLDKYDPKALTFSAEKSEGSRAQLYQKLVSRLVGGKWKQESDHTTSDYRSYFTIVRA